MGTLNQSDYETALTKKSNLEENENIPKEELDKYKVSTDKLYKQHFTFPEVAKNDYAAEQLASLEVAERNFNADLDNKDLLKTFVKTAETVKDNLKVKYGD